MATFTDNEPQRLRDTEIRFFSVSVGARGDVESLRRRGAIGPSPPPTSSSSRTLGVGAFLAFERLGRLYEPAPVFERLRRVAMNLQPCQRLAEGSTMHEGSSCPWGEVQVEEPALQAEDMPQPFDVPARQGKKPE